MRPRDMTNKVAHDGLRDKGSVVDVLLDYIESPKSKGGLGIDQSGNKHIWDNLKKHTEGSSDD